MYNLLDFEERALDIEVMTYRQLKYWSEAHKFIETHRKKPK